MRPHFYGALSISIYIQYCRISLFHFFLVLLMWQVFGCKLPNFELLIYMWAGRSKVRSKERAEFIILLMDSELLNSAVENLLFIYWCCCNLCKYINASGNCNFISDAVSNQVVFSLHEIKSLNQLMIASSLIPIFSISHWFVVKVAKKQLQHSLWNKFMEFYVIEILNGFGNMSIDVKISDVKTQIQHNMMHTVSAAMESTFLKCQWKWIMILCCDWTWKQKHRQTLKTSISINSWVWLWHECGGNLFPDFRREHNSSAKR